MHELETSGLELYFILSFLFSILTSMPALFRLLGTFRPLHCAAGIRNCVKVNSI